MDGVKREEVTRGGVAGKGRFVWHPSLGKIRCKEARVHQLAFYYQC